MVKKHLLAVLFCYEAAIKTRHSAAPRTRGLPHVQPCHGRVARGCEGRGHTNTYRCRFFWPQKKAFWYEKCEHKKANFFCLFLILFDIRMPALDPMWNIWQLIQEKLGIFLSVPLEGMVKKMSIETARVLRSMAILFYRSKWQVRSKKDFYWFCGLLLLSSWHLANSAMLFPLRFAGTTNSRSSLQSHKHMIWREDCTVEEDGKFKGSTEKLWNLAKAEIPIWALQNARRLQPSATWNSIHLAASFGSADCHCHSSSGMLLSK